MAIRAFSRVRGWLQRRFGVLPWSQSIPVLAEWFETPLGEALLLEEKEQLNDRLSCLFGYHMLQLSVSPRVDMMEASRISHRFSLNPDGGASGFADFNHLPLAAESIDLVLLHHVLDFSQSPHQLLRESVRVLIPKGYVIIIGFQPWSFLGVCRWFGRLFSRRAQWRHQSLRLGRLLDWMALVDLTPAAVYQGFYRPAVQRPGLLKHLQWLERWGKRLRLPFGGFYLIVARKDMLAMTPLKPVWKEAVPLPGLGVTKIQGRASPTRNRRLPWRNRSRTHTAARTQE